jgi:hypothetical protein
MRDYESEIREEDSLLVAELKEFYSELKSGKPLSQDYLKYLEDRYDKFCGLEGKFSGIRGLCQDLLEETTLKLIEGASILVEKYGKYKVPNEERGYFLDIFMALTKCFEGNLSDKIKKSAENVSEDIARVGGL